MGLHSTIVGTKGNPLEGIRTRKAGLHSTIVGTKGFYLTMVGAKKRRIKFGRNLAKLEV